MHDNTITLKTEQQDEVALWLDAPLVDLARPVVVERDGRRETFTPRPNPETFCEGLEDRGDPRLAAPVKIFVRCVRDGRRDRFRQAPPSFPGIAATPIPNGV